MVPAASLLHGASLHSEAWQSRFLLGNPTGPTGNQRNAPPAPSLQYVPVCNLPDQFPSGKRNVFIYEHHTSALEDSVPPCTEMLNL